MYKNPYENKRPTWVPPGKRPQYMVGTLRDPYRNKQNFLSRNKLFAEAVIGGSGASYLAARGIFKKRFEKADKRKTRRVYQTKLAAAMPKLQTTRIALDELYDLNKFVPSYSRLLKGKRLIAGELSAGQLAALSKEEFAKVKDKKVVLRQRRPLLDVEGGKLVFYKGTKPDSRLPGVSFSDSRVAEKSKRVMTQLISKAGISGVSERQIANILKDGVFLSENKPKALGRLGSNKISKYDLARGPRPKQGRGYGVLNTVRPGLGASRPNLNLWLDQALSRIGKIQGANIQDAKRAKAALETMRRGLGKEYYDKVIDPRQKYASARARVRKFTKSIYDDAKKITSRGKKYKLATAGIAVGGSLISGSYRTYRRNQRNRNIDSYYNN